MASRPPHKVKIEEFLDEKAHKTVPGCGFKVSEDPAADFMKNIPENNNRHASGNTNDEMIAIVKDPYTQHPTIA